jgi:hypothetical protein
MIYHSRYAPPVVTDPGDIHNKPERNVTPGRDIWIGRKPGTNLALYAEGGETRTWAGVHFIEYIEYERVLSQLETMVEINQDVNAGYAKTIASYERVCKERDELEAELNEWRGMTGEITLARELMVKAEAERDQILEQARKLREVLEQLHALALPGTNKVSIEVTQIACKAIAEFDKFILSQKVSS